MISVDWPTVYSSIAASITIMGAASWWITRSIDRLKDQNERLREQIEDAQRQAELKTSAELEELSERLTEHQQCEIDAAKVEAELRALATRIAIHERAEVKAGEVEARLDERIRNLLAQMNSVAGKLDLCTDGLARATAKLDGVSGYIANVDQSLQRHKENTTLHGGKNG
jgi:chromosome segregation ATPase